MRQVIFKRNCNRCLDVSMMTIIFIMEKRGKISASSNNVGMCLLRTKLLIFVKRSTIAGRVNFNNNFVNYYKKKTARNAIHVYRAYTLLKILKIAA